MKMQADKHRMERTFAVGDWVYLKLKTYVQTFVAHRTSNKLSYKYFGPYLILQRVGPVADKLQLPPTSHIHHVVHVSQMKKAIPPNTQVNSDAGISCLLLGSQVEPLKIVHQKMCKVGNKLAPMVQVQWSKLPASWMTWEHWNAVKPHLPDVGAHCSG
jgi:hypothetical protein